MTTHLPVISGRDAVRAFGKVGFEVLPGRGKGSHIVMVRKDPPGILTIPDHRELKRGTLRSLIRSANLSIDQFRELL
jgi:predicted RNA binding protein YcfA (HicA-like mRNA interferase family)